MEKNVFFEIMVDNGDARLLGTNSDGCLGRLPVAPFSQFASVVTWNTSGSKHVSENLVILIRRLCSHASEIDQLYSLQLFQRAAITLVNCSSGSANEKVSEFGRWILKEFQLKIEPSMVLQWTLDLHADKTTELSREEIHHALATVNKVYTDTGESSAPITLRPQVCVLTLKLHLKFSISLHRNHHNHFNIHNY